MPTIQELIAQADEAYAQEIEATRTMQEPSELHWIQQQLPAWRRWYLKRNQQGNYFRVTRIIPPGMDETPFFWRCRFQIWIKGKLKEEYPITPEAFEAYYGYPEWEKQSAEQGFSRAILRPPAPTIHQPIPGNDY